MYGLISEDYLMHHGVKGMKWGVRHDPDRININSSKSNQQEYSRRTNNKKWLKRGAIAAGVVLGVSAGVYLSKSGKGKYLINIGKKYMQSKMVQHPVNSIEPEVSKVDSVLKEMNDRIASAKGSNINTVKIPRTNVNTVNVSRKKLDDPSNFTWEKANRITSDGKVSSILLPTDRKGYADAFAKEMSKGKSSDYDYWYKYIMNRMR